MGAVIAIKTSAAGNDDDKRRAGMRDLGLKIIEKTSPGTGLDYLTGLHDALKEIVDDSANYVVLYNYTDDAGNPAHSQVTKVKTLDIVNFPDIVRCALGTLDGSGDGADGRLRLHVTVDDRSGSGPQRIFHMNVVFPKLIDNNNYNYLVEVARDVRQLGSVTEAQDYLAAFKFLSRCK